MVNKLEFLGRNWFDRVNGNTYFSAIALYNGNEIARIDFDYGYGDQWLYEITKLAVVELSDSYIKLQRGENQQPWQFIDQLESSGVAVFTNCEKVTRKRDLKF